VRALKPSWPLKKAVLLAVGLALAVLLIVVFLRSGPLAPVQVVVATVREGSLQPGIVGIGTVEARRSWMVGPTSAGRVRSVMVDVGDTVRAGQLLAEMDAVDIAQRIAASQATVARAGHALGAAQAQLADAQARRELAVINAQRNRELAAQNFISAGALEARLQEKASADAAYQGAQANLAAAGQELARTQAEREALVRQRANVRLVAPNTGVVISRDAEAGSTVVAGQAVLRMVDPGSLWVKMRVDQGRSMGLAPGLPAAITLRAQPQQPFAGRVARVEMQADSVTEERVAHVVFEAGSEALHQAALGELAEVRLQLPRTPVTLLVPNAALQRQQGTVAVWRLREGALEWVPVRLGVSDLDGQVQVLEGLQADDQVVVYSQKALTRETRIRVVEALPGTRAGAVTP